MSEARPPVIEVADLTKVYDAHAGAAAVRALDGVSLRIEMGESVALIGPSGSGKSTLMHIIGCLDRPSSGRYLLAGEDVSRLSDDALAAVRNKRIGFVFQSFYLLARQNALENVALPMLYAGTPDRIERARVALERVGLADRATHLPSEMSGGQRQRVAIARAIVMKPAIVMADEPTGALDTATGREILGLLDELHAEGTTLIVVTHDRDVAARAHRVIALRDGKIESDTRRSAAA